MEQLVVLCEGRLWIGEDRSAGLGTTIKKNRRKAKLERKTKTKAEEKDPPFHEPNPKGWGTPARKDGFKIVSANEVGTTRRTGTVDW